MVSQIVAKRTAGFLAVLGTVAVIAGCGSDSGSTTGSNTGSGSGTTAPATTTAAQSDAPPTKIPVTVPLQKAPPKGVNVVLAECTYPTCTAFVPGYEAAAKALGWNLKTVTLDLANPNAGLQNAVDQNPDFIIADGPSVGAMGPALAAAHQKKIPVIIPSGADKNDPANGVYTQINDGVGDGVAASELAKWAIDDSDGKANMVLLSIHALPVEQALAIGVAATFKTCPACKLDRLDFTADQLGSGKVSSLLVAYLQAHPDTNYVLFSFGDAVNGVPETLQQAGLAQRVKLLVNHNANPAVTKYQVAEKVAAQTAINPQYLGWIALDAAARLSVQQPVLGRAAYVLPPYLVTSSAAAKALEPSGIWDGPEGYEDQFKSLWQVG